MAPIKKLKTYKDSGVNIVLGDEASKIMFKASKLTWVNRKDLPGKIECPSNYFSSLRMVNANKFKNAVIGMNFDGVGTKIEIAERMNDFSTIAFDLFAMICDDAAVKGGEPIHVGSIIDCNSISIRIIKEFASGMIKASKEANVSVINGEIAELGDRVGGFGKYNNNWGGAVFWIGKKNRMITGKKIKPGDSIIAVSESGLRSNGLSLIRKVFKEKYGELWHKHNFGRSSLGRAVILPSRIYTSLMVGLHGGYSNFPKAKISGFSHITGGGIPGKLGRLLSETGCGAKIDNLFKPAKVMFHCQSLAGTPDEEAYRTWNMGQGLLIVTPDKNKAMKYAEKKGFKVREAGQITKDPKIEIKSRGYFAKRNTWLSFPVENLKNIGLNVL